MSKLEQAINEAVELNKQGTDIKAKRMDLTYGDIASGKVSKAKAAQTINNKKIAAALTKVSIALEAERKKIKEEKLANKTYYDDLAVNYLTPEELERYRKVTSNLGIDVSADEYNKVAKKAINDILKSYNIDIDSITIDPKEWPEYKKTYNNYKDIMSEDAETTALREAARKKDAIKNKVHVPKGRELWEKGTPVLGLKSNTGKADTLKPLVQYKKSITGEYIPTDDDDDEDFDDYSVDFLDEDIDQDKYHW